MSSPAAFNAVFRELVTVVKNETGDKDVKNAIKARYRVWNAGSPEIAQAFHERFSDAYPAVLAGGIAGFDAIPGDVELLAGKTVADVIAGIKDADFVPRVKACVAALMAISMAAHVSDDAAACDDVMKRTQKELGGVTAGLADVVMDEELVAYVQGAAKALAETGGACGLPVADPVGSAFPESLPDGAIMAIARDISAGIDPEMLSRPDGMQSLVQTVSAGIGERIGKGEIDPNALMAEATEMLKHVDLADTLKMLGGMGGGAGGLDLSGIDLSALAGMMGKAQKK